MAKRAPTHSAPPALTLDDLLDLPALERARVVPHDADLAARVLTVAAAIDGRPSYPSGTLLLGSAERAVTPPDGVVAVLASGTAGVDVAVPLIVIDESAQVDQVTMAVVAAVAGAGAQAAASMRRQLREALISGAGLEEIARLGRDGIGAPIEVLDAFGERVAGGGMDEAHSAALVKAVAVLAAGDPMSVIVPLADLEVVGISVVPVTGSAGPIGAVAVQGAEVDRQVAAELAEAIAIEFARLDAQSEAESRMRGELIEELMAGETMSRDTIIRRARLLGADLSSGGVGLIGTLQAHDPSVVVDDRVAHRFVKAARAVIDHEWPRALVDWNDGRMLALLPSPPDPDGEGPGVDERAHELARRLLAATRDSVPGVSVTLALSRHTSQTERLGAALDEAELALSIGERLGRLGEVVTFEETGTYKLLFQIFADRPQELSAFYDSTLAPLVAYDEQYQTDLVGTLATYLELDGNLAATASTLYTHRHTVRYRLDRIAELAGLDVGKSDDREKLSLGLKAMRLLGLQVRSGIESELPVRERSDRGGRGRGVSTSSV